MNVKYIAYAALGISVVSLAIGIKAINDTKTTNELLGAFLRAKAKTDEEEDEVNTRLDDYIEDEESTISEDADLDVEDLDKTLEEEISEPSESSEPTGGIEYLEEGAAE